MNGIESDRPALAIGTAGLDMVGRIQQEPEKGSSSPASIRVNWGGVARNVAENLARLGQPVALLSAVGDDFSGDALCRHLNTAGVETSRMLHVPDIATGSYMAVVGPRGDVRLALDDMRAMQAVTPEWLERQADWFDNASLVFLDMNLTTDAVQCALRLAARAKVPVAADPVSRALAPRLKKHLRALFAISLSAREAGVLLGRELLPDAPDQAVMAARELVTAGVRHVIIALEEFGVAYADPDGGGHVPALRAPIVDPTGASDALNAAVLYGLATGIPLDESVKLGVAAAALTIRSPHAVVPELTLERLYEELM